MNILSLIASTFNLQLAAVNWLFTGSSGYLSSWDMSFEMDGERCKVTYSNEFNPTEMRQLRDGFSKQEATYARIAAKERGEHAVP